jgi:hypothetical protein
MQLAGLFRGQRLNCQALTAFGTARIDDRTATAGFHAYQETMGAGATGFRRLVSAFHVDSKYLNPDDQGNRRLSQIFIPHTSPVCRLPFRLIF